MEVNKLTTDLVYHFGYSIGDLSLVEVVLLSYVFDEIVAMATRDHTYQSDTALAETPLYQSLLRESLSASQVSVWAGICMRTCGHGLDLERIDTEVKEFADKTEHLTAEQREAVRSYLLA